MNQRQNSASSTKPMDSMLIIDDFVYSLIIVFFYLFHYFNKLNYTI